MHPTLRSPALGPRGHRPRPTIAEVTTSERTRIDFGSRIGVWWASDSWAMPDAQAVARDIEAMGYGSLFLPETVAKECLTESAAFLAATDRLVHGTTVATNALLERRGARVALYCTAGLSDSKLNQPS